MPGNIHSTRFPYLCRRAADALSCLRSGHPVVKLFTILAETAGAGGLNIAETFPEGRALQVGKGIIPPPLREYGASEVHPSRHAAAGRLYAAADRLRPGDFPA